MNEKIEQTPITPESTLAAVKEMFAESRADFDRKLAESAAEFDRKSEKSRTDFDRRSAEFDRELKESRTEFDRKLAESAAEFDRSLAESRAEFDRRSAEFDRKSEESRVNFDRRSAEFDRNLAELAEKFDRKSEESRADFDRELKESRAEFDRRSADFDRRMKKLEELTGSYANNNGAFAEEYFFNSFEKGQQNFFGEKFDDIDKKVKGIKKGFKDEYDILLINGQSIGIVEIKYKAHENDVPKVLNKAHTFKVNFPEYENHKVFLGLASMAFYPKLEEECKANGIAIVKQIGENVVIYDEHLKAF